MIELLHPIWFRFNCISLHQMANAVDNFVQRITGPKISNARQKQRHNCAAAFKQISENITEQCIKYSRYEKHSANTIQFNPTFCFCFLEFVEFGFFLFFLSLSLVNLYSCIEIAHTKKLMVYRRITLLHITEMAVSLYTHTQNIYSLISKSRKSK